MTIVRSVQEMQNYIVEVERQVLDDRLALVGILQELTVAVLDLFDPSRATDDFLQTVAARFNCRVALCLETVADSGRIHLSLHGAAGLAHASRALALPTVATTAEIESAPLPYPEVVDRNLTRWIVRPRDRRTNRAAPGCWLLLYFEREPRLPRQYHGMLERLAHHLGIAFEHRRLYEQILQRERSLVQLNEELERRVAERTYELAQTNQELETSLFALKQAQDQLLQAGKLAAVGQLAAGVAHEINNPLAVILGFGQVLERRVPTTDPLRLPVSSIVRESLRCKSLVQELLTFSRFAKKTAEDVDPNAILLGACQLLESRARTQGTRVVLDLAEDVPMIRANRNQLQQVIINLGNNALDALRDGGELVLKSAHADATVVLEVRDNGPGIPEALRDRIFEPFFTTKEVGKGTGLGLSLVYEIVQQHGGRIDVRSTSGQGTSMTVRLPIGKAVNNAHERL